jgi:hypothetical protein
MKERWLSDFSKPIIDRRGKMREDRRKTNTVLDPSVDRRVFDRRSLDRKKALAKKKAAQEREERRRRSRERYEIFVAIMLFIASISMFGHLLWKWIHYTGG